jgi:hypothetical protein
VKYFYIYTSRCNKNDACNSEFCSQLLRREGTLKKGGFLEKLLVVCPYCEVTELMASYLFFAIIFWGTYLVAKTTLPPSCADCFEIWVPQPPGNLGACPGL